MVRHSLPGHFEQLVMSAIVQLGDDAYGVTIRARVQELGERKVSLGPVYVTLDRLEAKGFVSSWLSEPIAERGGRARRCYKLEGLGERALKEAAQAGKRVWDVVEKVFGSELDPHRPQWKPARQK